MCFQGNTKIWDSGYLQVLYVEQEPIGQCSNLPEIARQPSHMVLGGVVAAQGVT